MRRTFAPIVSLYIGWQLVVAFAGCLTGVAGLVMLFDILELLRRTSSNVNMQFATVFGLALLKMPHTVLEAEPFVVMLAMMYALFRLSRNSELLVMRAAGISVWQLLAAPVILSTVLGTANLLFVNPYSARLYDSYQHLEDDLVRTKESSADVGANGLWLREAQGSDATILHAAQFHQEDGALVMQGVSIFRTEHQAPVKRYEAAAGRLGDGAIAMTGVKDITFTGSKEETEVRAAFSLPTTLTAASVQDSFAPPETMSFGELGAFIEKSEDAGFSVLPHRLYWHSQLVTPVLLTSMVMVAAAAYMTANARLASWVLRGAAGIAIGFCFYVANRFAYALGLSTALPTVVAAWAPTLMVLMSSLGYLLHSEDG